MTPRILILPGSVRAGSFNRRLAEEAGRRLALTDAALTMASLADYPLPIFDAHLEAPEDVPENARLLAQRFALQDAVLFVTPEYNAGIPPLLKNAIDWVSRVREANGRPLRPFAGLVAGLASASPNEGGGRRGLQALRAVLMSLGAEVLTAECSLAGAATAFDADGRIADGCSHARLERLLEQLLDHGRALARHA